MSKFIKKCNTWALGAITLIFTFIPETCFGQYKLLEKSSDEVNIVLNRLLTYIVVLVVSALLNSLYFRFRRRITIKGANYSIQIKYGDLLQENNCKKIISFDECFTTNVGNAPSDVNANSVCGQFLQKYPLSAEDMLLLIENAHLKPARSKSKFGGKVRYDSGKLVPYNDYLLMAFAKLNENGSGEMTRDEFLDCLSILWTEIEKYYGQEDVCIPILGSGVTHMGDESLTQQKLLDIIIESYKLNAHKIKHPCQLHIICKDSDGFSLNKIGETL